MEHRRDTFHHPFAIVYSSQISENDFDVRSRFVGVLVKELLARRVARDGQAQVLPFGKEERDGWLHCLPLAQVRRMMSLS